MPFEKQYEIMDDAPKQMDWGEYCKVVVKEYEELLEKNANNEAVFQRFFEENPSFLPGALELFGQSGHYPYMDAVISQPEIGGIFKRKPDFVWLANDSLNFVPVFIEIEKPSKKMFNLDGTTTADFNQALGQIHQWQYLLSQPMNIQLLYEYFDLPLSIREKTFKPQYLLIYGRRSEYEGNKLRTGIRAANRTNEIEIMSYDRLRPLSDYMQFISCKMSHGLYKVLNIPPTYRYRADSVESLIKMNGFYEKITMMKYAGEERKKFLQNRYEYWYELGREGLSGTIYSQEGE